VGIRAPEAFGGEPGPGEITSIAREYLAAVREAQPEGPYLVGGFCMGGPVAVELGRLLVTDGEQVGVVLLDPRMSPPRDLRSLGWTICRRLRDRSVLSMLRSRLRTHPAAGSPRHWSPAWDRLERARNAYTLEPLDVPTILVRSADFDAMGVPLARWRRGLPQLVASPSVGGTHNELFYSPHIDEVAAAVATAGALLR
jgi:thioesterase domain-containing protein